MPTAPRRTAVLAARVVLGVGALTTPLAACRKAPADVADGDDPIAALAVPAVSHRYTEGYWREQAGVDPAHYGTPAGPGDPSAVWAKATCVFRRCRSVVSLEGDHVVRSKPISRFGRSRSRRSGLRRGVSQGG